MIDVLNSRRNRPELYSNSPQMRAAVTTLLNYFVRPWLENNRGKIREADINSYQRHLNNIASDLFAAWSFDKEKSVGYSRGKNNFVRGGVYWDHLNNTGKLSHKIYISCIDTLFHTGFLESDIAAQGRAPFSSRMRALPALIALLKDHGVTPVQIGFDTLASAIVVKDENKRVIPPPYDKEFDIQEAENNLRRINDNLHSSFINLNVDDATFELINAQRKRNDEALEDDDSELIAPLDFSYRRLRRIFANGKLTDGGRFYGGWWQGVPSEFRRYIEIDGAITVECDFSTMQPRILYAKTGIEAPADSYHIPDWADELRPIIKKAFSQLINYKPGMRERRLWHLLAPETEPEPIPENWHLLNKNERTKLRRDEFERRYGRTYDDLIHDLLELHKPIADFFFSSAWTWVQRLDSDIAEEVMLRMLDEQFTALPIHDSFLVRRGGEGLLVRFMNEAFKARLNMDAKIDREAIFPSPFEKGPNDPNEKRLIWAGEVIDEARQSFIDQKIYGRNIVEWERTHGPL